MSDIVSRPCTAFARMRRIAQGPLIDVALAVKAAEAESGADPILTFDDATGKVIDLDLRGSAADIVTRLDERTNTDGSPERREAASPPRGRGRPKLGVVAREVTLLPRHWDWLAVQPGGASQALRRLVDQARRDSEGQAGAKQAQERTYRFMSALAGDLPGFEEATRALFRSDAEALAHQIAEWPSDVRDYVLKLAAQA